MSRPRTVLLGLLLAGITNTWAQTKWTSSTLSLWFADGTGINIQTESTGGNPTLSSVNAESSDVAPFASFPRVVLARNGAILFAYDVEASKAGLPGKAGWDTFRLRIKPSGKKPTVSAVRDFPLLRIGDAVQVDILQNPATGEKIYDVLTVLGEKEKIFGPNIELMHHMLDTMASQRTAVDARVELMSIIFRLAGNPEFSRSNIPAYNAAIDSHFARFRDHEAVRLARELHAKELMSHDAVVNLAIHVKDIESLAERVPFDRDPTLEPRWHGAKARRFLQAAHRFVVDTDFAGFLKSQQRLFDVTASRLLAFAPDPVWFERFYGPHSSLKLFIVPAPACGENGYGARIKLDNGEEEFYAFVGIGKVDTKGLPEFGPEYTANMARLFAFSYIVPLVYKLGSQLERPAARLVKTVAHLDSDYNNGRRVVIESLVRAVTARYIFDHQGPEAGERAVAQEWGSGFLWIGDLVDLLGKYEQDRGHYPTLESFGPRLVSFFADTASHFDQLVKRRGRLGMVIQPAPGVLVASVTPGGAAERAGIHNGDIITAINGIAIYDPTTLFNRIAAVPGKTMRLSILRDGRERQVIAKVEETVKHPLLK